MKKKFKKQLTGIAISIIVVALVFLLNKYQIIDIQGYLNNTQVSDVNNIKIETQDTDVNNNSALYEVIRVVDGDTFVVKYNGENEKVRLIGIDTPESVHPDEEKNTEFGDNVSSYTKEMLTGKKVQLEFDVEQRDQYGRLLAYVYINGQMYNKILLEKGYAKLATYPPNVKYVDEFTVLQKEARENKVGLWAY